MTRSGFTFEEIETIVDVVIAILFIGNIEVTSEDDDRQANID